MKDLINLLPTSWSTFLLKDYMKCVDIPISEGSPIYTDELFSGLNNTLRVISALTDTAVDELEAMDFALIQQMGIRLSFMQVMPQNSLKSAIKWKQINEITYNDFVSFLTVSKDAVHNMPDIIKTFSKEPLTDEEILNLPMSEVHAGFFTLKKYVRKYTNRLIRKEALHLTKLQVKHLLTPFRKKYKHKGKN